MSEIAVTVLKVAFLALLWLFILSAASAVLVYGMWKYSARTEVRARVSFMVVYAG